jgi:hypothetical protein
VGLSSRDPEPELEKRGLSSAIALFIFVTSLYCRCLAAAGYHLFRRNPKLLSGWRFGRFQYGSFNNITI